MSRARFFVTPDSIQGERIVFDAQSAHQIRHVLRLRDGQHVTVLDNSGLEYEVELDSAASEAAAGHVVAQQPARTEPRVRIRLHQALLKLDKFEWVLQKGTELGIASFVPLLTQRVVRADVGGQKRERWRRIVREAAEQSERGIIPSLCEPVVFEQAIGTVNPDTLSFIPYEEEHSQSLRAVLRRANSARPQDPATDSRQGPSGQASRRGDPAGLQDSPGVLNLFIGPEGGFTADEIEFAEQHGVVPVTLGPRILRAETAGLVAASAILYEYGDL